MTEDQALGLIMAGMLIAFTLFVLHLLRVPEYAAEEPELEQLTREEEFQEWKNGGGGQQGLEDWASRRSDDGAAGR